MLVITSSNMSKSVVYESCKIEKGTLAGNLDPDLGVKLSGHAKVI